MNGNNIKPYLPFGSIQTPRMFSRLRNAWVALVTAPSKLSIQILDDYSNSLDKAEAELNSFKCPALIPCYKCKDQVECSESLKKVQNILDKKKGNVYA